MSMSKIVVFDLFSVFLGIDEVMSFVEVMKYDFVF